VALPPHVNVNAEKTRTKDAANIKARVEDTIRLLNLGRIEIPPDADPGVWIMSAGKMTAKPMHSKLAEVMRERFAGHPGGPYTIAAPLLMPCRKAMESFAEMTAHSAHLHFKFTLADSKWKALRGFHVLRHSFGSNLARSGKVPRDTIAKWMGHSTEELKDLYQHLFPQDGQSQIEALK
jgi:integrase